MSLCNKAHAHKLINIIVAACFFTFAFDANYALADTVQYCGSNGNIGDYRIGSGGDRVWCATTGIMNIVPYAALVLSKMYILVKEMNFWVALAIFIAILLFGNRLTGSPAYVTGRVVNGIMSGGSITPAKDGTATTFVGRLLGVVLKLIAVIGLIMCIISAVYGR